MFELTIHLNDKEASIAENYMQLGFLAPDDLVAAALRLFYLHHEQNTLRLQESASLYAEIYAEDDDVRALTESATAYYPSENLV
jgi:hypothetical protein